MDAGDRAARVRRCGRGTALCLSALAGFSAQPAQAQVAVPRPADERPALPEFPAPEAHPGGVLPPLVLPEADRAQSAEPSQDWESRPVHVAGIRVLGNTVIPPEILRSAIEPYAGRELSFEQLLRLQDELTLLYVQRGYVTSGAVLSRALAADGFAEFQVTEGVLREVRVAGAEHFRESVLSARARPQSSSVVNVGNLEQHLRAMQDDPRIDHIEAKLVPGPARGQADLELIVHERSPYRLALELDNQQTPAVGDYVGRVGLEHLNLTGHGDVLQGSFARTAGLDQLELSYEHPLGPFGTSVRYRYETTRSEVVEEPFAALGIASRSASYALEVRQPLVQGDGSTQVDLFASGEYRRSVEFLFGDAFSFAPGVERGATRLAVLQLGEDLTLRSPQHVLAARSVLRWGLDALGATHGGAEPDGQFLSWLAQAQWAQRLPHRGITMLLRADLQLSSGPLPGIEQFGIGGHSTVRGYRENRLVRDDGWVGSLELRVPLWRRPSAEPLFELVPFVDVGRSWNQDRATPGVRTLSSAGIGLLFRIRANVYGEVYYAHGFRDLPAAASRPALQDRGVHFRIGSVFQ